MRDIPFFRYAGKTEAGIETEGTLEAPSRVLATVQLRRDGIWITELAEAGSTNVPAATPEAAGPVRWSPFYGVAPVSAGAMGNFLEQLAGLYTAGVNMHTLVGDLATQISSPRLRRIMREIAPDIQAGKRLSECLARYPQVFPAGVVGMIKVGELTGNLDEAARDLASDYHGEQRVWWALSIPKMYFSVVLLLVVLVPSFPGIISAPDIMQGLNWWVGHVVAHILPWIGVAILAYFAYRVVWHLPPMLRLRDTMAYTLPIWSPLTRRAGLYRYFRGLEIAISAGVSFPEATEAAADAAGNRYLVRQLRQVAARLRDGIPVKDALAGCHIMPPDILGRLGTAERAGTFDDTLPRMAEQAKASRDNMVRGLRIAGVMGMLGVSSLLVLLAAAQGYAAIYKNLFNRAGIEDMF